MKASTTRLKAPAAAATCEKIVTFYVRLGDVRCKMCERAPYPRRWRLTLQVCLTCVALRCQQIPWLCRICQSLCARKQTVVPKPWDLREIVYRQTGKQALGKHFVSGGARRVVAPAESLTHCMLTPMTAPVEPIARLEKARRSIVTGLTYQHVGQGEQGIVSVKTIDIGM